MVIENTVEATPIIDPAMIWSMLLADCGRAGTIAATVLRNWANPLRSSHVRTNASTPPMIENSAG